MKETVSKVKRQPSEWEKIIENETADKELNRHFSKEDMQMVSKNTWKDAQHHSLSEKCKSKPQWGTISPQSEWFPSKSLQTIDAGECVEKTEHSCTIGGNVNWYSHHVRHYGDSLKKLEIKLPYDPAIPHLDTYPKENKIEKYPCIPLFIPALFTMARTWKQPRCPSTDKWIKRLWYIYTMEYYSAIKRNAFESVLMRWMNLEPIIQSEVSQKDKVKYHILMHICSSGSNS